MGIWEWLLLIAVVVLAAARAFRRWAAAAAGTPPPRRDSAGTDLLAILARHHQAEQENPFLRPEPRSGAREEKFRHSARARREPPPPVEEDTTVVLRKQVPPRSEAPRSWVGGLPFLPPDIEWPRAVNPEDRDGNAIPLHFVCQIALADLPPRLWGGLGPRAGWLLLFSENNSSEGVYRLLHTTELGEERAPPGDIGVVHDGMYCDATDWKRREVTYPRVAVDLVSMPNRLYDHEGHLTATPENLAQLLYEGEPIGDNGLYRSISTPFSWRCIALAVDATIDAMDDERICENAARNRAGMLDALRIPDLGSALVHDKEQRLECRLNVNGGHDIMAADLGELDEQQARRRAYLAQMQEELDQTRDLVAAYPDDDELLAFLEGQEPATWQAKLRPGLIQLRALAESRGLDSTLSLAEWYEIKDELARADRQMWLPTRPGGSDGTLRVSIAKTTLRAIDLLDRKIAAACGDTLKLYYLDAARRALVPPDALGEFEEHMRSFHENRPHRMGGYHDGVQSETGPHPTGKLLLLQLSCDYALEMLWGDCGAIYAWIDQDDLAAGRFERAEVHLECH